MEAIQLSALRQSCESPVIVKIRSRSPPSALKRCCGEQINLRVGFFSYRERSRGHRRSTRSENSALYKLIAKHNAVYYSRAAQKSILALIAVVLGKSEVNGGLGLGRGKHTKESCATKIEMTSM